MLLFFYHHKSSHHGKEVVIALDLRGHLGELLVESIGDVVSWIGGDDEDTFSDGSELDSQTAAGEIRTDTGWLNKATANLSLEQLHVKYAFRVVFLQDSQILHFHKMYFAS